jgi:hypothetical protein
MALKEQLDSCPYMFENNPLAIIPMPVEVSDRYLM